MSIEILAISGSLRAKSSNRAVVNALAKLAPQDMNITVYKSLGDLPHFNPEIDVDPAPEAVRGLRRALTLADGIFICTPEYAFGVPGVLKNALDWTVSSGEFTKKPLAVVSASPGYMGGAKAHASLVMTMTALDANIIEDAKLQIGGIYRKLDDTGALSDPQTLDALRLILAVLRKAVETRSNKYNI